MIELPTRRLHPFSCVEQARLLRHYVRDFRMTVRDGGLVLYGHTRTYYSKQLVQHGVVKRSRLPIRANNIEVL
jgi:hypothetical protein